jgi:hypothetical protein
VTDLHIVLVRNLAVESKKPHPEAGEVVTVTEVDPALAFVVVSVLGDLRQLLSASIDSMS